MCTQLGIQFIGGHSNASVTQSRYLKLKGHYCLLSQEEEEEEMDPEAMQMLMEPGIVLAEGEEEEEESMEEEEDGVEEGDGTGRWTISN